MSTTAPIPQTTEATLDRLNRNVNDCFSHGYKPVTPVFFRHTESGEITVALPHLLADLLADVAANRVARPSTPRAYTDGSVQLQADLDDVRAR